LGADVDARDADGNTSLMLSVARVELAEELIEERHADVSSHEAQLKTAAEITHVLRAAGATEDGVPSAQLASAARRGVVQRVRELLAAGANPNHERAAALRRAAGRGHVEVVHALLEAGADPNGRRFQERTALIEAAENGHVEIVRLLADRGADLRAKSLTGTALDHAREESRKRDKSHRHEAVIAYLESLKAPGKRVRKPKR
jgi:ankyrin repeat protein